MRLALELHEAKQQEGVAKAEAAEARLSLASVDGLRARLSESSTELSAARREVERLTAERAATLEEHGALLEQARSLATELEESRQAHSQLSEQKLALFERINATEHTLATLRSELGRREEDFEVDMGLFAQRDEQQRGAIEQQASEAKRMEERVLELEHALGESRQQTSALLDELERMELQSEQQAGVGERAEEERLNASARLDSLEDEMRRERQAYTEHIERTDARHALLATRLEEALKELQQTVAERDRLSGTLEEALARCTSSLVAKRIAEDDLRVAQEQFDALRTEQVM
jgi:chromosome segregation ATPase